jgi:hypothetical protein
VPLLIERSQADMPEAPDGVTVIGCDGISGTRTSEDVQRVYEMSLDAGVWKLWRDGAPFSQRFTGQFPRTARRFAGRPTSPRLVRPSTGAHPAALA